MTILLSNAAATWLGKTIAFAVHECKTVREREGALLARTMISEGLFDGFANQNFRNCEDFNRAFERTLRELEPLNCE